MTAPSVGIQAGDIPQSMRSAKRWLLWKSMPAAKAGSKPRKVPFYADGRPRSGKLDSDGDADKLVTYAKAQKALAGGRYAGLGFALGSGWQGLDLDGVRDAATGRIDDWAREIIDRAKTYAEVSPSGTGVHLIGRGLEALKTLGSNKSGVEFYSEGRYFTVTGDAIKKAEPKTLAPVYSLAQKRWLQFSNAPQSLKASPPLWFDAKMSFEKHLPQISADDRDLWLKVGMAIHKESGGSNEGYGVWTGWSAASEKFDPDDQWRVWQSFKDRDAAVGIGTVIAMAREGAAHSTGAPSLRQRITNLMDRSSRAAERRRIPEPDYYIEGLVLSHLAGVLVSQGGLGKTILLILLGIQTALGGEWLGMPVKKGSFVLLSLDDPQDDLDTALTLLVDALPLSDAEAEQVFSAVILVSLRDSDDALAFAATVATGDIGHTQLAQDITDVFAEFHETRPGFDLRCIVFDTLRQFAGGTTNDDRVMTLATKAVTRIADRLKCAAIITHHTTKAGAREGFVDQYSGSGSGALADNLRFVLALTETDKGKVMESLNVAPLLVPLLETSKLMVLYDTRGSLLRNTQPPIYIARNGYRFTQIKGQRKTAAEKAHSKEMAVLRAVTAGDTSNNSIIERIRINRKAGSDLIKAIIGKGLLKREGGDAKGKLVLTDAGRQMLGGSHV